VIVLWLLLPFVNHNYMLMKKEIVLTGRQNLSAGKFLRRCKNIVLLTSAMVFANGCDFFDGDSSDEPAATEPHLTLIAEGFSSPLVVAEPPDNSGRLFVVEQTGMIKVISKEGQLESEPFLDISSKLVDLREDYDERGLLGLAFHPQFASNGKFYVFYSAPLSPEAPGDWDHTNYVSEFTAPANRLKADPATERVILFQDHPYFNHNGGTLAFGPADNYLYISIGDGGNRDDEGTGHVDDWYEKNAGGNGQDITQNRMGDILRIDVDSGSPYGVPADNPFVDQDGLDEIFAYGFRNPYRFSFDMGGDHALYSQDAGQDLWEEINLVEKGGNYGWNVREGTICFDAANPESPLTECPDTDAQGDPLIEPVITFENSKHGSGVGVVIVGGYVYRGAELPHLDGAYIFGTWSKTHDALDGAIFISRPQALGQWEFEGLSLNTSAAGDLDSYLLGFGQDAEGEMYVLTTDTPGPQGDTGKVYKLTDGN
jgi:glucose/arabinose dehydrogenase